MCQHTSKFTRRKFINTASGVFLISMLPMQLSAADTSASPYIPVQTGMAELIKPHDECAVCGMTVSRFPGPKGQVYLRNSDQVRKFCATKDLFSFTLDPEFKHQVKKVYVHDMAHMEWDNTDDHFYIDGKQAFYVVGSSKQGSMGSTLASFLKKAEAEKFAQQYGGTVHDYDDLKLEMVMQ